MQEETQANAKYVEQTQALQAEYDEENKRLKVRVIDTHSMPVIRKRYR